MSREEREGLGRWVTEEYKCEIINIALQRGQKKGQTPENMGYTEEILVSCEINKTVNT